MKMNGTLSLYFGCNISQSVRYVIEDGRITLLDTPRGMDALGAQGMRSYSETIFNAIKAKHADIFPKGSYAPQTN